MTLIELIQQIKISYPDADTVQICRSLNELEYRISEDVLKPAGLPYRAKPLDLNNDQKTNLIIGDGYSAMYIAYISAFLSMSECDFESANAHSALFNQKYTELSTEIRRKHLPVSKTHLKGGMLS